MKYKTQARTDVGIKKKVNQDALLIKQAKTKMTGNICMACLCDGMGGLSCGEVASAAFVERMDRWFKEELPAILKRENVTVQLDKVLSKEDDYWNQVRLQWGEIVQEMNRKLAEYGDDRGISLGTTVVAFLIMDDSYLIMNVGDSRAYRLVGDNVFQLTHDQSFVQREIDAGRMTVEEANKSKQKSVLLQCIGASSKVVPDFFSGEVLEQDNFLLCSDGLWRRLGKSDFTDITRDSNGLIRAIESVKHRGETDNISGIVVSAK